MQNRFKLLRGCVLAAAVFAPSVVSAQSSNVQPRITAAVDESQLTTLRGNTHPLARPEFDRGPAPPSLPMERMLLVLKRSSGQEAALDALLDQQQDKSSRNYHAWLTPQQFGQQFGPADQDIQAITSWLQSHGFQVNRVANGRTVIEFSGTAGQVRDAFHTEIHRYTIDNEDHWANSSDPQIPTALTPVVTGVDTLHNFPREAMHHVGGAVVRSKDTGALQSAQPLFTLGGTCGIQGLSCYGVGPYDFATIYNVLPLWKATPHIDGTGQTIAIVGESDINIQDVRDFRNYFGLPANDPQFIVDGPDPGTVPGDETESDLDVEWSGAVARGATIDFVISQSTEASLGVDLSVQYIVDNNLAPIVSES
jgi:subtilase family serine protease